MYSMVMTAANRGLESVCIQVEADVSDGLPVFDMVGFLSSEVREARERVRTALHNCGYRVPAKRITVNLSPADVKKSGSGFDLPVAVAILAALGEIKKEMLNNTLVLGEISLNGRIQPIRGILPTVAKAKETGIKRCLLPCANKAEAELIPDMEIWAVETLQELVMCMRKGCYTPKPAVSCDKGTQKEAEPDFSEINGQAAVKRACEVAVAGMHNFLMIGPPGSGKTMTARRIPGILPPMTAEEQMEVSKVYSICGMLPQKDSLMDRRPFRSPHHTISPNGLSGGGSIPKPGEISLAHKGVLFLDELPEYKKSTLEILRQPMEDKQITLVRQSGIYRYPADFMLVAAMNPCPCGYFPDYNRCQCTPFQIQQYQGKISQPFLNRMDICVEVPGVRYEDLSGAVSEESSEAVRSRVEQARKRQIQRYRGKKLLFNAELTGVQLEEFCKLGRQEEQMMRQAFETLSLTARTYHKVLKVARTIADLDGEEQIGMEHLQEALIYRNVKV